MTLSSSNDTHHPSYFTVHYFLFTCFISTPGKSMITAFTFISIVVLLPLFVYVLYVGHQQNLKQRSSMPTSHTDIITYHMVMMELITVFMTALSCCGIYADIQVMVMLGVFMLPFNINGQMCFHVMTCMERYLAIIHPVIYLSLKSTKWIRIRNIIIGSIWFICVGTMGTIVMVNELSLVITASCTVGFTVFLVSFCSISVLCALIRPGPGEGGGDSQRINQSKLRAFYTIVFILGMLLLRAGGNMFSIVMVDSHMGKNDRCAVWMSVLWFCLPSSMVLPLLFLHRAGKLPFCKTNNTSG